MNIRAVTCGYGINVATNDWIKMERKSRGFPALIISQLNIHR